METGGEHEGNMKDKVKNWYTCEDLLPAQGLWLLFDSEEEEYIYRDEIVEACGLEGVQ